jgi:multiple sugar transport system permease protein
MLSPSIFFATVMTLITAFQVFAQPYVLTGGGPGIGTTTMVMYLYQRGFQLFDLGTASAVASLLFVVIALITAMQFVGQKKWVHYE